MKKVLSTLAVSVLATSAFAQTQAHDTLDLIVNGTVTQSTCKFEANSQSVALGEISTNDLRTAGVTEKGKREFTVQVVNCPKHHINGENAYLRFQGSANVDAATGYLKNTNTTGTNVYVAIYNDENELVNLASSEGSKNIALNSTESGIAVFAFTAKYAAKEAATAGGFSSSVPVVVDYR